MVGGKEEQRDYRSFSLVLYVRYVVNEDMVIFYPLSTAAGTRGTREKSLRNSVPLATALRPLTTDRR